MPEATDSYAEVLKDLRQRRDDLAAQIQALDGRLETIETAISTIEDLADEFSTSTEQATASKQPQRHACPECGRAHRGHAEVCYRCSGEKVDLGGKRNWKKCESCGERHDGLFRLCESCEPGPAGEMVDFVPPKKPKHDLTCADCGKKWRNTQRRRWCFQCRPGGRRAGNVPLVQSPTGEALCAGCRDPFQQEHANQRYCRQCQDGGWLRRYKAKRDAGDHVSEPAKKVDDAETRKAEGKQPRTCEKCGRTFWHKHEHRHCVNCRPWDEEGAVTEKKAQAILDEMDPLPAGQPIRRNELRDLLREEPVREVVHRSDR